MGWKSREYEEERDVDRTFLVDYLENLSRQIEDGHVTLGSQEIPIPEEVELEIEYEEHEHEYEFEIEIEWEE